MNGEKKKALGKGLSALISDSYAKISKIEKDLEKEGAGSEAFVEYSRIPEEGIKMIPIKDIVPNRDQPRLSLKEESLAELAESIKEQGVLQPVVLTKREREYELICGERRVRAATLAGLEKIPAVVKEIAGEKLLELALVENLQREDLNPLEEALAYTKLIEERRVTQDEVAKRVGKNRSSVANTVRLLRLPKEVQDLLANDLISSGHARALVSLPTPEHQRVIAQRIVKENLSVRQTEGIVQQALSGKRKAKRVRQLSPYIVDLERKLEAYFGTQVRVFHNKKNQGRVEIRYFSLDELDRILQALRIERH